MSSVKREVFLPHDDTPLPLIASPSSQSPCKSADSAHSETPAASRRAAFCCPAFAFRLSTCLCSLDPAIFPYHLPVGDIEFIQQIGIMVVAATAVILISRRLNIPSIVLFIVTGLILGPITGLLVIEPHSPDHEDEGALAVVTEVGIALLLFLVGLELSLEKIKDVGKVAVVAGLGQVAFTALIGFFIAWSLQFTMMESFFIATALTFSSTVVVVKLLDQKKELTSLYGRIAVGFFSCRIWSW